MLGRAVRDPHGVEGGGEAPGLGLLDLVTELREDKTTRRVRLVDDETGAQLDGYEIHHGATAAGATATPTLSGPDGPLGWRTGNVRASYVHGLLEHAAYRDALLGARGHRPRMPRPRASTRDSRRSRHVRAAVDWPRIRALVCAVT